MSDPESRRRSASPIVLVTVVVLVLAFAWLVRFAYQEVFGRLHALEAHALTLEQADKEATARAAQAAQVALMPVIADARKLTESLNDPDGAFQQTLKSGHEMALKFPALAEKTNQVIDQTQEAVKTIQGDATATLQRASRTVGVIEQAAPEVIDKVRQAVATSQATSAQVQAMAVQANEKLPAVLDQVQAAATQTNDMVSTARQTWPISMLTGTPTGPQSLPIDSIGGLPLPGEAGGSAASGAAQ
jgi:transcriptional regulator